MSFPNAPTFALLACSLVLFKGCSAEPEVASPAVPETASTPVVGNAITGEGLPNPTTTMTTNWGELPMGRMWGSTAGIDIDPTDGNIWAYERCGAGPLAGAPMRGGLRS